MAELIYFIDCDAELAKYILSLQNLSAIEESDKNTRKENVINSINKMRGYSKVEKLLLAFLCGYSINERNENTLASFLISKSFSRDETTAYLG